MSGTCSIHGWYQDAECGPCIEGVKKTNVVGVTQVMIVDNPDHYPVEDENTVVRDIAADFLSSMLISEIGAAMLDQGHYCTLVDRSLVLANLFKKRVDNVQHKYQHPEVDRLLAEFNPELKI